MELGEAPWSDEAAATAFRPYFIRKRARGKAVAGATALQGPAPQLSQWPPKSAKGGMGNAAQGATAATRGTLFWRESALEDIPKVLGIHFVVELNFRRLNQRPQQSWAPISGSLFQVGKPALNVLTE